MHLACRRFVGAFVHLLMLHVLVVGSGDACVLPAVAGAAHGVWAAGSNATDDVSGMAMPGHSARSDGRECDGSGGPPAGHKQQPTPGCQSMAPCAPAALAATAATVVRPTTLVAAGPTGVVVLVPPSRTSAPEPPPPRA